MSAREKLGMEGRFCTNGLELKKNLFKKQIAKENVPKEVATVTAKLQNSIEDFHEEEVTDYDLDMKVSMLSLTNEIPGVLSDRIFM